MDDEERCNEEDLYIDEFDRYSWNAKVRGASRVAMLHEYYQLKNTDSNVMNPQVTEITTRRSNGKVLIDYYLLEKPKSGLKAVFGKKQAGEARSVEVSLKYLLEKVREQNPGGPSAPSNG